MAKNQQSYYTPTYLRAWREYKGIGIQELAAWSGLCRETVWSGENGHRRFRAYTIKALADTLGVTREQLMHEPPPT